MPGRHDSTQPSGIPRIELPGGSASGTSSMTARLRAVALHKGTPPPVLPLAHPGDRVLLLQGPYGPFFRHLAGHLSKLGATVRKINFNGGDRIFYPGPGADDYLGESQDFAAFLREYLATHRINRVFLYSDCRDIHRQAIRICRERGIPVRVFEEGYFRPDYVTCELDGVNGFSSLPRDPSFYMSQPDSPVPPRRPTGSNFWRLWFYVELYMLAGVFSQSRYPNYRHHKRIHTYADIFRFHGVWLVSAARKIGCWLRDRRLTKRLSQELSGKYFLVPLQVYDDSQVLQHSRYTDMAGFMRDVIASFAQHAPAGTLLVLKHHPMDRGYQHYGALVQELTSEYQLGDRVIYTHDIHLPTALDHALGVVTINSTVGLSALWHKAPVKTLGAAVYDMPGLTFQGSLDDFWKNPGKPSRELYERFHNYLVWHCQLNESFSGKAPFVNTARREMSGARKSSRQ